MQITIEDQIRGMKMLDKAYDRYKSKGLILLLPYLYEYGFQYMKEVIGMKKLNEIAYQTGGTRDKIREAHIKYLFDVIFDKNT